MQTAPEDLFGSGGSWLIGVCHGCDRPFVRAFDSVFDCRKDAVLTGLEICSANAVPVPAYPHMDILNCPEKQMKREVAADQAAPPPFCIYQERLACRARRLLSPRIRFPFAL